MLSSEAKTRARRCWHSILRVRELYSETLLRRYGSVKAHLSFKDSVPQ